MSETQASYLGEDMPRYRRLAGLPRQLRGVNPFAGDSPPSRIPLFSPGARRPCLPFPHPWNYLEPIQILESCFAGADDIKGPGRHNRYLDIPGCTPVFITRDPAIMRAIMLETGDRAGQFYRDTLPFEGIAHATGWRTLLSANGSSWRRQRKLAATPFGKTKLFQLDRFQDFEGTFRNTASARILALREHLEKNGKRTAQIQLEPEVKAVMLEMLTNNFFGASIPGDELRNHYVPALERVIEHIVHDTILRRLGIVGRGISRFHANRRSLNDDNAVFEKLTDLVVAGRRESRGLWVHFKADDLPDDALRGNLKVFLAGALEATTSYACWAITHLARNLPAQEKLFTEIKDVNEFTPDNVRQAQYLAYVLDETLRLTPSLYFLPRVATTDRWVETTDGRKLFIPAGIHILLDAWHANRHEDHWGVAVTGHPAMQFVPERWANIDERTQSAKNLLHFGFGFGARICPGQHLGQLEASLVVGAVVKLFKFRALNPEFPAKAGVSTKPLDGTLVELEPR